MGLLTGMRVLSIEQYGAGPFGTQLLAGMGAEVIKVEQPHEQGDVSRQVGPWFDRSLPASAQSLFFQSLNCGKKSISVDLMHKEGRQLLMELAPSCDVVASNLRGDVPQRLGLTYAQLAPANPRLVCAHLTGYGREGERANWPGYDYLMQAEAGYFSLTGEPDSAPSRMGLSIIDYMSGVMLSLAITSALLDVQRGGVGRDVDVALFDVALFNLNYLASWYLNSEAETGRQPRSAHPSMTPCQLYRTRDGWIYLMCNKEKFWRNLCECLERPQWLADARFTGFAERLQHRDVLGAMLDGVLVERDTAEWMALFAGRVPAAPILSVAQALDSPFAQARDAIATVRTPEGHALRMVRSPLRVGDPQDVAGGAAPTLGQHTDEILLGAGVDAARLARLKALGVL
ncbi:CaiB/BaiF CoA transferase family protein [Hydrogenophaga sp. BPS33]|uniref:CaiB/BaiF CoA transferase family protein n=1 Tax=Hydrogenophaga sp. BPS33 TaxID=2651974 RepID=UPI00131FF347|nr:CoA transferase [Hydrogenophaga sp. BPS33]QHE85375.1 CoA transferase [Hydrogenophaga sp. BPS33]